MKKWDWLEEKKAIELILCLLEKNKIHFQGLVNYIGGSNTTIRNRINTLKEKGIIIEEIPIKNNKKETFGRKHDIYLTEKGKKIGRYLKQIEHFL